jgi:prolyl-tRNA editing enzyme YbaK/EbsC (Cys-tRNA(Pro) deacylase)
MWSAGTLGGVAETNPDLHPNSRRVQDALAAAGCSSQVHQLAESARTSAEAAAAALGVSVGQIAKSLVFLADGRPVMVIASGADRVDLKALARVAEAKEVSRPGADVVREATGYPIGGVSPAGLRPDIEVLVDNGLAAYGVIWAAAGTPHAVYRTTFADLLKVTGGRASDVSEPGPPPVTR